MDQVKKKLIENLGKAQVDRETVHRKYLEENKKRQRFIQRAQRKVGPKYHVGVDSGGMPTVYKKNKVDLKLTRQLDFDKYHEYNQVCGELGEKVAEASRTVSNIETQLHYANGHPKIQPQGQILYR